MVIHADSFKTVVLMLSDKMYCVPVESLSCLTERVCFKSMFCFTVCIVVLKYSDLLCK